jgi:hypothetical protein
MRRNTARVAAITPLALAGLFVLDAPRLDAQCAQTAEDTGFAEVIFKTPSGTFDRILPFDVPVRICADVAAGTTTARVKYAANLRRRGPVDVEPDTCAIKTPGVEWGTEYARAPVGTSARWVVDRLEARRYYVFCFTFEKAVTPEELAAFRTVARRAIDQGAARIGTATLTPAETKDLCTDLRTRLLEVTAADRILDDRGTLFACDDRQMPAFAAKVTRGVVEPQRRVQVNLEGRPAQGLLPASPSLVSRQNDFERELAALQADPAMRALGDVLERQAAVDAATGARLKSLCPDCLGLIGPTAAGAASLAHGGDPTAAAPPPLTLAAEPAQARAMAASYQATAKTLDGLLAVLQWTTGPDGAAVAAGLAEDQRASLAAAARDGGAPARARALAATLAGTCQNLEGQLAARAQGLDAVVEDVQVAAASVIVADGSTSGNFATQQRNYISADAGFVWAPELDELVPYLGTNLYFRPVNKNAPLATLGGFGETFTRRFALTFALTASSISDDGDAAGTMRDDLFASQSLLVGAGLRVTDSMRLGAGAIVFKRDDPSPLIDDPELNFSYYLAFSFDMDVVSLFSRTFGDALNPPSGMGQR